MNPGESSALAGFPTGAAAYVQDICMGGRMAAFMRVDAAGRLVSWGGTIGNYITARIAAGMHAEDMADMLVGLVPLRGATTVLPMVELPGGRHADIHLVPDEDGGWIFLLDSSAEANRRSLLQQYAHDMALSRGSKQAARQTGRQPAGSPTDGNAARDGAASGAYGMIGRSAGMRAVYQLIADVAEVDATVLITGETGTGKELVARAIHEAGARKDKPFVVVNCAGLSDSLINSQLFGHKKGAFTDAVSDQKGFLEAAHSGTLLLDEIGDIPMNTQTRILRALEQKEIIRIGETVARAIDVRVLAATHKDLSSEVRKGAFREDLLYRIRVARIDIPPLRTRREDIPLLTRAILDRVTGAAGRRVHEISQEAADLLRAHDWPGNVRELRNAVEFAVIHCKTGTIQPSDLPPEVTGSRAVAGSLRRRDGAEERELILAALAQSGGRREEAAGAMGISRATLYRRMKACGLDPERRTSH